MTWVAMLLGAVLLVAGLLCRWGMHWGSTRDERAAAMPGDDYLTGDPRPRVVMTRAITIRARPDDVWPWIAQLGRGAGFYSVDRLDNGGKASARHVVSWIPSPQVGDATAIGYLREVEEGCQLAWWLDGTRFVGATTRLVVSYRVTVAEPGARVISRISADATGRTARLALLAFVVIDSIMACLQLQGLRDRIERSPTEGEESREGETGERDQYQFYEVIYASGERAGAPGQEEGARWRQLARDDGVL